jgi:hypothetical protein
LLINKFHKQHNKSKQIDNEKNFCKAKVDSDIVDIELSSEISYPIRINIKAPNISEIKINGINNKDLIHPE